MLYDFDTTATSPVLPQVLENYAARLSTPANNPSSPHGGGIEAAGLLERARLSIAHSLDCLPEELIFMSGGTESINLALKGAAAARRQLPKRAVTSLGEHDAVLATLQYLEENRSYELVRLPLLPNGQVDGHALENALEERATDLVSLIAVSNESGAVNDLEELVPLIRSLAPRSIIHGDMVQACGKLPFSFRRSGLDLASVAGHKIGAPKGTGLLIKRRGIRLEPLLHGGGQQSGVRPGTLDVAGAMALADALTYHLERLESNRETTSLLRQLFLDELDLLGRSYQVLSPADGSPYVLSIAFPGLRGETLMHALSAESIYIATGSACGSGQAGENRVLLAMGFDKETVISAVRISFNPGQTAEDVRHLARRIDALYARYALTRPRGTR